MAECKGRVLFFHGFTQTASLFYAKTSALRKRLIKLNYKPVYLNGPVRLTPSDLPSRDSLSKFNSVPNADGEETDYRGWWFKRDPLSGDGIKLDDSIVAIKDYVENGNIIPEEGFQQDIDETDKNIPVVGLIGFSQGACLAGIICHMFNEFFHVDTLNFVVLYSGFKLDTSKGSGQEAYNSYFPTSDDKFKMLHVYGELDTVVEASRSEAFYESTKEISTLLKHPGGHFVPNSKLMIDHVTNWIQSLDIEQKKEEKEEDIMDMFDKIGH